MLQVEKMLSDVLGTGSITELSSKTKEELSSMLEDLKVIKSGTQKAINWLENKIKEKSSEEESF